MILPLGSTRASTRLRRAGLLLSWLAMLLIFFSGAAPAPSPRRIEGATAGPEQQREPSPQRPLLAVDPSSFEEEDDFSHRAPALVWRGAALCPPPRAGELSPAAHAHLVSDPHPPRERGRSPPCLRS